MLMPVFCCLFQRLDLILVRAYNSNRMPRGNKELSLFLWNPLSRFLASAANRWTSFIPPPPRHPSDPPRRVLLLHAHPMGTSSFNGACFETTHRSLQEAGHEVQTLSLYEEGFQPCMQASDIREYMKPLSDRHDEGTPDKAALLRYIDLLKWCDALIFVYPTWWYAMVSRRQGNMKITIEKRMLQGGSTREMVAVQRQHHKPNFRVIYST